jgi:signal peptidase I
MKKRILSLGKIVLLILGILVAVYVVGVGYGNHNRWYRTLTVDLNSMSPTLNFGDLIIITPPTAKIPAGTIITMLVDGQVVTHRLIAAYEGGRPKTQGDANNVADDFSRDNLEIVGIERFNLPGLGFPVMYARSIQNWFYQKEQ